MATTAFSGIGTDCVMTDLSKGSYLLTRHLLKRGHRKIFLIWGYRELLHFFLRINGYKQAYEEMGFSVSKDWILKTKPYFQNGYEAAEQILISALDAISAINDLLALGALECLKDYAVTVPGSVSVAGYDYLLYNSILDTPLSTVRQLVADIAVSAVETLLKRISGDMSPVQALFFEPSLKIRATTR